MSGPPRRKVFARTALPGNVPGRDGPAMFLLEPMDAWFFRDGRPFDATDPAQMPMASLFPPMPQTAIGAVRAALAMTLGWDGRANWSGQKNITDVVGSDDCLGKLEGASVSLARIVDQAPTGNRQTGPALEPLFAAPPLLFGDLPDDDSVLPKRTVRLGLSGVRRCDLGAVRLPVLREPEKDRGCKPLAGKYWLTSAGMAEFLRGQKPNATEGHLVPASLIHKMEARTGLQIDHGTRTAVPGMLYRVGYVRPRSDLKFRVGIAVGVKSIPGTLRAGFPRPGPFGGEGRMAWITMEDRAAPALPASGNVAPDRKSRKIRYTVTLATPADLGQEWPKPGAKLCGLPGAIVSACIDKALSVSGWISRGKERRPRQSRAMIPAGSTWFLEAPGQEEREIRDAHGSAIGAQTQRGYGRILIGTWSEQAG